MINRASAERPRAVTSFRLRDTMERRLSSSFFVAGCRVTLLLASSFAQVIFATQHDQPRASQYLREKMVLRGPFPVELGDRVDSRIDLAAELFTAAAQRQCQIRRRYAANHHQVDVALTSFLTTGNGAVDEGERNFRRQRLQGVAQNVNETGALQQQTAQFRKKGRIRIGLVVDHTALAMALQY